MSKRQQRGKLRCVPAPVQATPKLEDFPALGGAPGGSRRPQQTAGPSGSQATTAAASSSDGAAAADGAPASTGVSDALKAANKASINTLHVSSYFMRSLWLQLRFKYKLSEGGTAEC